MFSRIFIRFLLPPSQDSRSFRSLLVRSVLGGAPAGRSVPGAPRAPSSGCGVSVPEETEEFLRRGTHGTDVSGLLALVDITADDALPSFHSREDSTRGEPGGVKCSQGGFRGRSGGPREVARGLGQGVPRHIRQDEARIRDDERGGEGAQERFSLPAGGG